MLSPERRKVFLDYLTEHASDAVLLEAVECAEREYTAAYLKSTNMSLKKKAPLSDMPPAQSAAETSAAKSQEKFEPLYKGELPKKLAAVGQACLAVIKRRNRVSVQEIGSSVGRDKKQILPQLALAESRGFIRQVSATEYEFVK